MSSWGLRWPLALSLVMCGGVVQGPRLSVLPFLVSLKLRSYMWQAFLTEKPHIDLQTFVLLSFPVLSPQILKQEMRRVFAVSMSALVASMSSIGLCAPLLTSFSSVLKGLQHELHSIISPRVPELSFELPNNLGSVHPLDLGNGALRLTLPFAEAPLGDLRFANPQPLKTLSPDFDATKAAPSCFQGSTQPRGGATPSEDCLYMT